jgi:hypothetical protein
MNENKYDLDTLMAINGVEAIGAAQRTIAFSVVADYGNGLVNITATSHGLKKNQTVSIIGGAYAGIHRVRKVIGVNNIAIAATFGATATGNLLLTGSLDGAGFVASGTQTIAEIEPDNKSIDVATLIARTYAAGEKVAIPFKKIRLSAGNITVIRKNGPPADLSYTNR